MGYDENAVRDILHNRRAHDRVATSYERDHGEIYNEVEQHRLRRALSRALEAVQTGAKVPRVLDFGCGAGNLTQVLSGLGCDVVASDISNRFLELVAARRYATKVETARLNGSDLSEFTTSSMDMVATYSVLHHVPDYLGILGEFVRVLKPGGVVFIDHEASPEVWAPTPARLEFLKTMRTAVGPRWRRFLRPRSYVSWLVRKFVNPRYHEEGDIHVFEDDHIEWDRIVSVLETAGLHVVAQEDYLLFRRGYDMSIYDGFRGSTADIRLLIARKPGGAAVGATS